MKRTFKLPSSRDTLKQDLNEELAFHLQGRIDDLMTRGLTREDAEREARRLFGDRAAFENELARIDRNAHWIVVWREFFGDALRDARLAVRGLIKRPVFTLTVIATLALGIGANTAIFSVADALLFRAPPYPHPEQLVSSWGGSAGELFGIREMNHVFRAVATYSEWAMNVGDASGTARVDGSDVSDNLFSTLGVRPAMGRDFTPGASKPGVAKEVILSDALWHSQFGSDSLIVGKSILVEGVPRTVVGVMPATFHFPSVGTGLWFNSVFDASQTGNHWGWLKYSIIARLRDGVTVAQAAADIRTIAPRLRKLNPLWDAGPDYGKNASVTPLQERLAGPARTTLLVLLGVVFSLLLIACANVANLILVRGMEREREFAVRTALGCSRLRLARQLVTENLMLSVMGGIAAMILAWGGVALIRAAIPVQIVLTAPIAVNARVLVFTALLAIACGLVFGLAPSFRAARSVRAQGLTELRGASRGIDHTRLADTLTLLQLALAVVLVAGSALLLRSFDALQGTSPGFSTDNLLAARVTLPAGPYRDLDKRRAFERALMERMQSAPGVQSIAAIDRLPLRGPVYGTAIRIEGKFEDAKNVLPTIEHAQAVSPSYFATMNIKLLKGRAFTAADREGAPPVAIISESIAKRFWPNGSPIGQRIGEVVEDGWVTVVGVAAEVQQDSVNGNKETTKYRPLAQVPSTDLTLVAKLGGDVQSYAGMLRAAVKELDATVPVSDVRFMSEVVAASYARSRFTAQLLTSFALLALAVSAVGLYGVVSSTVHQRTKEMGVRLALGATPRQLLALVMSRGALLTLSGSIAGTLIALLTTRWMATLLYGVTATDPVAFLTAPLLLIVVGLLATWMPARRAVRGSPLAALRND